MDDGFQIYTINSKFRISGTSSNFSYNINLPKDRKYDYCCLLSASIPISYYLIHSNHNTFQLRENSTTVDITVPIGNYSRNAFMTVVKNLMNTNSPNGWTYNITFPNDYTQTQTGKFTYTVSGNSSQPSIIMNSDHIYRQFGFSRNSTNTFSSNSLTSTNVINFMEDNVIYIHSDICASNTDSNVLCDIYSSNAQPYSFMVFNSCNFVQNSRPLSTNDSNIFNFSIMNVDDEVLDLNGNEWACTILFYKKEAMSKLFRNYLKYKLSDENDNTI